MKKFIIIFFAILCQSQLFGQGLNTELGYNSSYNQYPIDVSCSEEFTYMSWWINTDNGYGPVLDKIDTNGVILWSQSVAPVPNAQNFVKAQIPSSDGGIYVAGHSTSGCDIVDDCKIYIHKYSASGISEWTSVMEINLCNLNVDGFSLLDDTLIMICVNPYSGPNKIYQVDTSGVMLDSIETAQTDILGIERFGTTDYVGFNADSVFTFDQNGSLLDFVSFDTTVVDISTRNDSLFVLTEDSIMLFNSALVLMNSESTQNYGKVEVLKTTNGKVRFVGQHANHITHYEIDEQLQMVDSINMIAPININEVDYALNHLSVGYQFPLTLHNSIRYLDFSLVQPTNEIFSSSDVGIIDLEINDMTVSSPQNDLYSVNFYCTALVKNFGPNPVSSVRINKPFMQWICSYIYYTEDHGSITIASGDSLWLDLGWIGGSTYYLPGADTITVPLCVFTSHPNHLTDLNVDNDEFCKDVVIGYLGQEENARTKISVYPNPTKGDFTIMLEEKGDYTISVVDLMGQTVYSRITSGNNVKIHLPEELSNGTYFLSILSSDNEHVLTEKIQVLR